MESTVDSDEKAYRKKCPKKLLNISLYSEVYINLYKPQFKQLLILPVTHVHGGIHGTVHILESATEYKLCAREEYSESK